MNAVQLASEPKRAASYRREYSSGPPLTPFSVFPHIPSIYRISRKRVLPAIFLKGCDPLAGLFLLFSSRHWSFYSDLLPHFRPLTLPFRAAPVLAFNPVTREWKY